MSIGSDLARIEGAKAALKTSLEGKGVTVPAATKIDGYPALVDSIDTSGTVVDNGLKITEFDVDMNPTKVEVLGDTIWRRAFASNASGTYPWRFVTEIIAPDATEVFAQGINNLPALTSVSLPSVTTLAQTSIYGNSSLTSLSLPELTSAGIYTVYGNNSVQSYYFPKCTNIIGPMGFTAPNPNFVTAQIGSIGYPVTELSGDTFYNATSEALVITVYVTPGSQPLARAPWGATNATIVYRSAVDGSVL